jgi:hypothetical protein
MAGKPRWKIESSREVQEQGPQGTAHTQLDAQDQEGKEEEAQYEEVHKDPDQEGQVTDLIKL